MPSGSSRKKILEYISELGWTARIFIGEKLGKGTGELANSSLRL